MDSRRCIARATLKRDVALKLFPVTPENADALSRRVLREGSLLAKINHRNVVVVHGVEQSNGFAGLWMEFIQGRTMEDELRTRGPLGAEEATLIGVDLCRALAAVHGRGLVHRDIKAQNVMREEGGRTVLMDFGAGTERRPAFAGCSTRRARRCISHQNSSVGGRRRARPTSTAWACCSTGW